MNIELDTRQVLLSALIALVALASVFLALAPKASAELNDCPAAKICLWSGKTFGGQQSFWNGSETGCHALENIDPQSVRNHTGNHTALFSDGVVVGAGLEFQWFSPFGGSLCID